MKFQEILKVIPDIAKEVPEIAEKYFELAKHLPLKVNRDDMLQWAGVPRRRGVLLPSMVAFGSGVVVGAAAALMLAPSSGAELRRELLERLRARGESAGEPVSEDRPVAPDLTDEVPGESHTGHA